MVALKRLILVSTFCSVSVDSRAPASRKRGFVGYVNPSGQGPIPFGTCNDAEALGLQDSWFYNWLPHPYTDDSMCADHPQAAEYVPMIKGISKLDELEDPEDPTMDVWRELNAHFLLGFNEPDYGNGGNHKDMCSPYEAAVAWTRVQEIAKRFDPPLALVAPSVSGKGPDAWDEEGASQWLDYFLGNCSNTTDPNLKDCEPSSIQYIGMHDHGDNVTALMQKISGAATRYQRKVWLTEFNIMEWGQADTKARREAQDAFLLEALPALDRSPHVFRYGWVSARGCPNKQNGGSNLLPCDSVSMTLTSTGEIYAQQEDMADAVVV